MKTEFVSREGNDVAFKVVFSAEEFEDAIVEAYKKNKDKFRIDGFRKGKAPRKIIENHYGKGVFWDEAINGLLTVNYEKAVEEIGLETVAAPKLELEEVEAGKEVVINASVEVMPEIEVKDYFGVEVDGIDSEVGEEDVDKELKRIQKSQARLESVEGRKTREGDTLVFDFDGSVDGEPFRGGSAENYELVLGSGQFIPGFEEQLIGCDAGQDVDVRVTFPDDYHEGTLAGKEAVFKCVLHEIKQEILPEIDDDMASDVSDFETLDEYKADLKAKMQAEADEHAVQIIKDSILQKVYEANKFEVPAGLIEEETDRMLREMSQQMAYQGLTLEKYMEYLGQTYDDLREQARPDATQRVAMRHILKAVVNRENVEATDEDIRKELEKTAEQYQMSIEEVEKMLGGDNLRYFEDDVRTKKLIDMMYDKAVIKEPKKPAKAEDKAEEKSADAE